MSRVTDLPSGRVLYDHAFSHLAFNAPNGALLDLPNGGWRDYAFEVEYRNTLSASFDVRATSGGSVRFAFRRDGFYFAAFVLYRTGETP